MTAPLSRVAFLVLDDNANMVTIIRTVLKNLGAVHIFEANNVPEALKVARQYAIDIAFIDYNLGQIDGLEFVKTIRHSPDSPNPYLPIVMLTAHTELSRVESARDSGITEFCAKPVTAIELYRKVVEVIEHPRPFVRTDAYFGPDRRRRTSEEARYTGPERRQDLMLAAETAANSAASQA